ncbi:DUF305 domain-containing protein [Nocardia sp. NPDC005978]|uniref:DUF305 domain-containing protein n=1 Tax=Nocardia sp. NPDC005978 TaxID=3156725 RepID=UPI0033A06032
MFSATRTTSVMIAGAAVIALVTAGCGSDDDSQVTAASSTATTLTSAPAATRTDFDEDDVSFLQMMYPHHAQAVDMAAMVPSRSQNPELIALAASVEQAQTPEMQQITALLTAFGKGAPSATAGGHAGHGGMSGMMTEAQMTELQGLTGVEFDRMWMRMMIEHHEGAITMANAELTDGVNPDAKAMAKAIVTGQQTEIDQMRTMLGQK